MSWWRGCETIDEVREGLRDRFAEYAEDTLARFADFDRVVLHVAQFWNDQADDEVHPAVVLEAADHQGPHTCDATLASVCESCELAFDLYEGLYTQLIRMDWDSLFLPLQTYLEPYCVEGASQTQPFQEAYRPLLMFERRAAQVVQIGQILRPWLHTDRLVITAPPASFQPFFDAVYAHPNDNGPRVVLADLLQSRDDPRGRFMALQLQAEPTEAMNREVDQLWARHRNAWLGRLLPFSAPERCAASRGFVSTLALAVPQTKGAPRVDTIATWPEWSTIEHVELSTERGYRLFPALKALPRLTVPDEALGAMHRMGTWHCHTLRLPGRAPDPLTQLRLPALRSLALTDTHRRLPVTAAWWPQLETLDVIANTPGVIVQALSHPTAAVHFRYETDQIDGVQGVRTAPDRLHLTCEHPDRLSAGFIDSLIYMMVSQGLGWTVDAQLTDAQIERLNDIGAARWIKLK